MLFFMFLKNEMESFLRSDSSTGCSVACYKRGKSCLSSGLLPKPSNASIRLMIKVYDVGLKLARPL